MIKNMKKVFFVSLLLLLIVGISVVSATDESDILDDSDDSITPTTTGNAVEDIVIEDAKTHNKINNNDNIVKEEKVLKENRNTISVDTNNFDNVFTSNGLVGVNNGDTISFTGDISRTGNSYVVDKQVIIQGNDKTINLNTVSGSYFGDQTGSSFIFNSGAAYSTVTNINFYNTQIIVRDTNHITFNNLDVTVSNQNIGQGIGAFSIRDDSSYITVENSRFSTTNNGGSSTLVLAAAHHCIITHNTITGTGNVGNLLYLTTYNIAGMDINDLELNSYNTISYNEINGPSTESIIR